jgi:hypothetical protein
LGPPAKGSTAAWHLQKRAEGGIAGQHRYLQQIIIGEAAGFKR